MKPVPPQDWDKSLDHVVDDMNGRPLNIHSLMANHPPLLKAWWDLRMYLVNGGDLEQRHCELAILRIAVHRDSWYEWASHVVRGLACGLTLPEIERVKDGPDAHGWTEQEATLLRAVDELTKEQAISAASLGVAREHFSNQQMLDLIALHGMYNTIACMINTWELSLDAHIEAQIPKNLSGPAA